MSKPHLKNNKIDKSCLPLPLKREELEDVVEKAVDWALMNGAGMRSKSKFDSYALNVAPFILLPTPFPKAEFEKAVNIQPILNELMHKVAHDFDFLRTTLKETIKGDDFTKRLFDILEIVQKEGQTQQFSLGLLRSDYMLHTGCLKQVKQVEINSIASSFAGIGSNKLWGLHRYVLSELGHQEMLRNLPENNALNGLCQAMIKAWELYSNKEAVIMFLVEDVTYNICDQRFHEFEIRKLNPDIKVIRRTLTQVYKEGRLGPKKELLIQDKEVAVIYMRAGYVPDQYHTQNEWDARLLMERSLAIKCPSIHYHLAGCKKVQQALARPATIEKYLPSPDLVEAVHEIFTGLYSLDFDEYGDQAVEMAIANPERFVLKPQREGGGHNVYGTDVRDVLLKIRDSAERNGYILMDRINPPVTTGYMIRPGNTGLPEMVDLVSELGIFGAIIGDADKILYNKQCGHMLRTKLSTANEGGVAAGVGALDSPYLID